MLLATLAALVGALAIQVWRSYRIESQLLATETSRALLVGERLLQRALHSADVLQLLPLERRFVVRGDRVQVDDSIAWLEPSLFTQLRTRVARVRPAQLASGTVAAAVAAAERLVAPLALPPVAAELLPWLPPLAFAALEVDTAVREQHRAIVARRHRC